MLPCTPSGGVCVCKGTARLRTMRDLRAVWAPVSCAGCSFGACELRKALFRSVQSRTSLRHDARQQGTCLDSAEPLWIFTLPSVGVAQRPFWLLCAVCCPGELVPALILPSQARSTMPATVKRSLPRTPLKT